MRYDPSKYETVEQRLRRLHQTSPRVSVHTEIVWHDADFKSVCFKASLLEDGVVIATGFAYDWKAKDKGATTTNWVETSETSAVGRAIANSKYQDPNSKRPSLDEMEIATEREASSGAEPAPQPAKTWQDQMKEIVTGKEDMVTAFLLERKRIKAGQTWADIPRSYAGIIMEHPDKFLAHVVAHSARD
jgi:hypothetical protein